VHSSHSSPPPAASAHISLMAGLGQALRWLREKQARKQYRVADNAGITKGMLSAYETGRQRPSLETLEKILETLGCDLNDLHNALQIVNGHPERIKSWRGWQTVDWLELDAAADPAPRLPGAAALGAQRCCDVREAAPPPYGSASRQEDATAPGGSRNLDSLLGRDRPRLQLEEEQALNQMMDGFHSLVRYWHRSLSGLARRPAPASAAPASPVTAASPATPPTPPTSPTPSTPPTNSDSSGRRG
jgi:transcriptional regulator with XRE-family HTH domain